MSSSVCFIYVAQLSVWHRYIDLIEWDTGVKSAAAYSNVNPEFLGFTSNARMQCWLEIMFKLYGNGDFNWLISAKIGSLYSQNGGFFDVHVQQWSCKKHC